MNSSVFQLFVNRPVLATAVNLILLIIGLVAFEHLELRHVPISANNQFSITTRYPGANSLTVEQRVTKVLEDALSGLEGIKKLSSESLDSQSNIHIKFKAGVDYKTALSELRDRIFNTMGDLPEGLKRPEIREETESNRPLLYMAFEDKTRSVGALSDYIRRVVEDRLRLVEGVAKIEFWGDKLYQISILLDPARLMEHQITVSEVVNALRKEKSFASGGEIEKESGEKSVILALSADSPSAYAEVTIKTTEEGRICVKDVAEVSVTEKPTFLKMRINGQPTVGLQVFAKPQANPIQVADRVKNFVEKLQPSLPSTMKAKITYDVTRPFNASIISLRSTLWEAVFLVGVIIILSLASVRAAVFPMITVPLCLIGSFALMWIFGFSVNPVTILALVLAVGLVVDDAIVVVENIHHHMEAGLSSLQAARKSMKEITFAIIVMTLTLAAVYVPFAFQADESAVMFREFAWTLAGSVLISGFVALTLTPALCGKFLKPARKISSWEKITQIYRSSLEWAMRRPRAIGVGALIIALLGVWGFERLPSELLPTEDEDYATGYFDFTNTLPEAVKESWLREVEALFATIPERDLSFTGEWQKRWLWWVLSVQPRAERKQGIDKILKQLEPKLQKIVGPHVGINWTAATGLGEDEALKIVIQYAADYDEVIKLVKNVMKDIEAHPSLFPRVSSDETLETSRIKVDVNRQFAGEAGVSPEDIEDTLFTLLSGRKASTFNFKGFDYDVLVRADRSFRSEFDSLNQFFVPGRSEEWIPLGSLVDLKEVEEPAQIKHYERMRGAAISVTLAPNVSLEQAISTLKPILQKQLPEDASYRFAGKAEQYQEAKAAMWLTYGLSLLFIYLVLAALFESFVHPFIVLLTVPLSVTGAVWAINAWGGTNNIYTSIGLVTLIGLITKHGILIVDFANRLVAEGMAAGEAVVLAAERRLRPVLMTTLAMIFGAVPLLFSLGAGANARIHIGWVIIGGMIGGTLFSLYVVPVAYRFVLSVHSIKQFSINYKAALARFYGLPGFLMFWRTSLR